MNTVEASILLEEAIDLAAAEPDDAIYARLLAFRDGWFRTQRVNGIGSFTSNVGHYTAGKVEFPPVFKASPTATVEITGGKRVTVKEGDEIAVRAGKRQLEFMADKSENDANVRLGTYTLGPLVVNGVAYPGPISVDWTEP